VSAALATTASIPDWGRWALGGIALAGVASLGIATLIGPAARRLAGEHRPLTQVERQQMTATERVEAVNAARHTLIQAATGLVVIGGVVFTAQGLWYTAQSLDASRQAQRTAEQGQVTDRYTKAIEQLGSTQLDVRLGGLYALERLAEDSPRDHQTVYDVLTTFVREHDPELSVKVDDLPDSPASDVQAALTIIGRRNATRDVYVPDLRMIRTPGADLSAANLSKSILRGAYLWGADLNGVNLLHASLGGADLSSTSLIEARLGGADVIGARLRNADLSVANLQHAYLTGSDLSEANLRGADLRGAYLSGTNLRGADLRGANLTDTHGATEREIREVAIVDGTTVF
jgi:hypothetical protein